MGLRLTTLRIVVLEHPEYDWPIEIGTEKIDAELAIALGSALTEYQDATAAVVDANPADRRSAVERQKEIAGSVKQAVADELVPRIRYVRAQGEDLELVDGLPWQQLSERQQYEAVLRFWDVLLYPLAGQLIAGAHKVAVGKSANGPRSAKSAESAGERPRADTAEPHTTTTPSSTDSSD